MSEVRFTSDKNYGGSGTEVANLAIPRVNHVVQAGLAVDGIAEDHDSRAGIGQLPDLIKLLLTTCIPETQSHTASVREVNFLSARFENSWCVIALVLALDKGLKERCFANHTITDND